MHIRIIAERPIQKHYLKQDIQSRFISISLAEQYLKEVDYSLYGKTYTALGFHYKTLFKNAFGDETITPERIYQNPAQYEYTLISANSKYDKVKRNEGEHFTDIDALGYEVFKLKCQSCHSTELFTDQSFRNVGFPINPSTEEAGRGRVTGILSDYISFRVPSLSNAEFTAPYGSFGQYPHSDLYWIILVMAYCLLIIWTLF